MKTMMTLLFVGAMSTSALLATTNGQWAEERMKAKMGRYSPAEEARREAITRMSSAHDEACNMQSCCRHQHASAQANQTGASSKAAGTLLASKWGRTTPATESPAGEQTLAASNASSSNAWWRSKWGRSMPRTNMGAEPTALVERATCCD